MLRRPLLYNPPAVQQQDAVSQDQRLIDIVGYQHDGAAGDLVDAGNFPLQGAAGHRIEMQQRQQFAHALVNALTRPFQQLRHGGDILLHGPVGK